MLSRSHTVIYVVVASAVLLLATQVQTFTALQGWKFSSVASGSWLSSFLSMTHWDTSTPESPEDRQAAVLDSQTRVVLPHQLSLRGDPRVISTSVHNVRSMSEEQITQCLNIVGRNLGATYKQVNGNYWRNEKRQEMHQPGLVYVLLNSDSGLAGFISMRLLVDYGLNVAYLYEIQIDKPFQSKGLGSTLLSIFDSLPDHLNLNKEYVQEFGAVMGTSLTVFSSNQGAFKLYKTHGYRLARHSPRDRAGQKPEYYIMIKYSAAAYLK